MVPWRAVFAIGEERLPIDFGRYRLVRRIATGGMAEIFLAHPRAEPKSTLVVKRILPHLGRSEEFVSMFLDEARIAAGLNHPNVVKIQDVGEVDGAYYITMEYFHGEDVRRMYNRAYKLQRSLPLSHSIRIVAEAALGLGHAHTMKDSQGRPMGVVHRDVSPQNIVVTYDGDVKVVDFGIAKAEGKLNKTQAGELKGKYSYMSPEQALGLDLDHRSDIFALGVVLYETTTGTRLFKQKNELATLQAIIKGRYKPPSQVLEGYPEGLEKIVERAIAREPDDRYQTAEAMSKDLFGFLDRVNLYVEAKDIAAFMRSLFGETLGQERTTGRYLAATGESVPPKRTSVQRLHSQPPSTPISGDLPGFAEKHGSGNIPPAETEPDAPQEAAEMEREPGSLEKNDPRTFDIAAAATTVLSDRSLAPSPEPGSRPRSEAATRLVAIPTAQNTERWGGSVGAPLTKTENDPPVEATSHVPEGLEAGTVPLIQAAQTRLNEAQQATEQVRARPAGAWPAAEMTGRHGGHLGWRVATAVGATLLAILVGTAATRVVQSLTAREHGNGLPDAMQAEVTIVTEPGASIFSGHRRLGAAGPEGHAGPFRLPAGRPLIRVVHSGLGFERERTITVEGNKVYEFEVKARTGWVRVLAIDGTRVSINGTDYGPTPVERISLHEGVHHVTLENRSRGLRYQATVRIQPGLETPVQWELAGETEPISARDATEPPGP